MESVDNTNPESLKLKFLEFVESNKDEKSLSKLEPDEFRIATYNIHYFINIHEIKSTYDGVLQDIRTISADVIGLQEFILGNKVKINTDVTVDLTNFYDDIDKMGYTKTVLCNSVPSWFKSFYGNIALIHDRVCNNSDTICTSLSETIHTFEKSTESVTVSGVHEGTNETRCYIKIKTSYNGNTIYIYITHLDVASEELRKQQIQYIVNNSKTYDKNGIVFIMGDFNTFDASDDSLPPKNEYTQNNGQVIDELKNSGFFDCHAQNKSKMTTWNNTRVDFIFCNKQISGDFRAEYLYTDNSDHLPVVLTLTKSTQFNESKPFQKTGGKRSVKRRRQRKSKYSRNQTPIRRRCKITDSS
jgi:endonuclease/exonuclease/phosphatase family metal-dependent hydrolase